MKMHTGLLGWYRVHQSWVGYLAIFAIGFLVFAYFQYLPVFADPDSFYHAKQAVLLRDGEFSRTLAALPFTTLSDDFADQHFLYHLLLVPFVSFADPLIGLKLATVVMGSLLALTFYWFLRQFQVPWAFVITTVLLLVNPFMFRMNLAKASSLSLVLLLLGLAAAFLYKHRVLFVLSFLYVWFYGGFALLVFASVLFAVVSALHRSIVRKEDSNTLLHRIRALLGRPFRHGKIRRLNLRLGVSVVLGTILGLIVNPFFPQNLSFYRDQLFQIGILNYQKVIGVGGEWYPYQFTDLVANTVLVSIPLVIALVLFVLNLRRQSTRSIILLFLWLFFLVLTLKSRRYVEYYVPFGLLFAAFSLKDSLSGVQLREAWKRVQKVFAQNVFARIGIIAFVTYVVILLPTVIARDLVTERNDLASGFRLDLFKQESEWIKNQSDPGSIVFHSDWDEFPVLYYFNSTNRYIAGLDPTFFYLKDPDRHREWVEITTGRSKENVYDIVKNRFNAAFVFVQHDHPEMRQLVEGHKGLTLAFRGPDANVYRVD